MTDLDADGSIAAHGRWQTDIKTRASPCKAQTPFATRRCHTASQHRDSTAAALSRGEHVDEHLKFIASSYRSHQHTISDGSAGIRWGRGRNGRCLVEF